MLVRKDERERYMTDTEWKVIGDERMKSMNTITYNTKSIIQLMMPDVERKMNERGLFCF